MLAGLSESQPDELRSMHPMGRLVQPEEVALTILHSASNGSSFVTGSVVLVDGGLTAM